MTPRVVYAGPSLSTALRLAGHEVRSENTISLRELEPVEGQKDIFILYSWKSTQDIEGDERIRKATGPA